MKRIVSIAAALALALMSAACGTGTAAPTAAPSPAPTPTSAPTPVPATAAPTPTPEPTETPGVWSVREGYSPTTGLPWDGVYKPIAVVIENSPAARPQSGLSQADWVYEIYVEGMITRFLAIFSDRLPPKAGPIRSARVNLLDIQQEWGCAFVHYGASEGGDETICAKPRIPLLSFPFRADGVTGLNDSTFWRDKSRKAPHNAYNDLTQIAAMFDADIAPVPRLFCEDLMEGGTPCGTLTIAYNASSSYTEYAYDPETGKYLRSVSGKPFNDKETGQQIAVTNIIIERVSHTSPKLGNYVFQIMDLTGEGEAEFIMGGRHYTGTWRHASTQEKTFFYLGDGREITLLPGNTWVQILYPDTEVGVGG